jgi:tetratricopeptide (TPR) repeat protein
MRRSKLGLIPSRRDCFARSARNDGPHPSRNERLLKHNEEFTVKRSILAIILAGVVSLTGLGFAVQSISRPAPVDTHAIAAANKLVAAGHYAEAAQMYEQLIAQGAKDAALYYNLGNAALLLGDSGRAVAAFEQAAALAPRDADIRANLELARQQTRDRVNQVLAPEPARTPGNQTVAHQQPRGPVNSPIAGPLGALADVSSRWLTVDELALLALGAWLALGFLVFAYRGLQAERRPAVVRAAVAVAFAIVLATSGMLASRMATPRLAAPATIRGQPPAGTAGQQAATPSGVSNPSQG